VTQGAAAMAGRTCLVTGATSGIGKATATGLARLGAAGAPLHAHPEQGAATPVYLASSPEVEG
jgi:NAD(P)-dependent dehydrogenase (short-subunit alcohol dehydrogenase family)